VAIVRKETARRRRYGAEEPWIPLLSELGASGLRRALINAGLKPEVAGNLVWFLEDQLTLERSLSPGTRTRYRGVLASLDPAKVRALASRSIPGQFNSMARAA
jgi:hypothetical protein